jgi:hypothetical protein
MTARASPKHAPFIAPCAAIFILCPIYFVGKHISPSDHVLCLSTCTSVSHKHPMVLVLLWQPQHNPDISPTQLLDFHRPLSPAHSRNRCRRLLPASERAVCTALLVHWKHIFIDVLLPRPP